MSKYLNFVSWFGLKCYILNLYRIPQTKRAASCKLPSSKDIKLRKKPAQCNSALNPKSRTQSSARFEEIPHSTPARETMVIDGSNTCNLVYLLMKHT